MEVPEEDMEVQDAGRKSLLPNNKWLEIVRKWEMPLAPAHL